MAETKMMQDAQTKDSHSSCKIFVHTFLTSRFSPLSVAILAVILTLPSLKAGLIGDDYHHKLLMSGSKSIVKLLDSPVDMFRFFDGNPEHIFKLKDYGFLPWWTYENIKGAFWRPLASITHWLDYIIWPNSPPLMHFHSLLWYGALVMVVAFFYCRFATVPLVAGLAALLYAIDDAHGMPAGFLSNRNALMATFFGVLAIIAHDRWRRDNWHAGIALGPLFLAASLLSAEAGISTCAYLAAYAVFIDRGKLRNRFAAMTGYAAVVVVWRLLWTHLGYGMENIGGYVDPLREPLRFISAIKNAASFLLLGQLALPPSEISIMLPPKQWILLWRIPALVLAGIFILIHLIIAPLALPLRAAYPMMPKKITDKLMIRGPLDNSVKNQDLVIVNPPLAFLVMQSPLVWESNNQPMPRHLRILSSSLLRPVKVYRQDARTLVVRPEYGYYAAVLDALFRDRKHPFSVGDRVELTGMTVEIMELTGDGRPAKAAFTFAVPLEDPSLQWMQYKYGSFVPFTPPAIGENVVLQSEKPLWN
jgi:hypothetical protein